MNSKGMFLVRQIIDKESRTPVGIIPPPGPWTVEKKTGRPCSLTGPRTDNVAVVQHHAVITTVHAPVARQEAAEELTQRRLSEHDAVLLPPVLAYVVFPVVRHRAYGSVFEPVVAPINLRRRMLFFVPLQQLRRVVALGHVRTFAATQLPPPEPLDPGAVSG